MDKSDEIPTDIYSNGEHSDEIPTNVIRRKFCKLFKKNLF